MSAIRVVLAEDHTMVRAGLRSLLAGTSGIEVVGEAADGREALRRIAELTPDVALVDVSMPELNGLEVARRVTTDHTATRVLMLSMHGDEEYVARALRAGAHGYLLKEAGARELVEAIRTVARGGRFIGSGIPRERVERLLAEERVSRLERLTPRQREVLQLVAEGLTTREIAGRLGISEKTVEVHRSHLMDRVGIRDIAGLVRFAVAEGVVPPEGGG